MAQLPELFPQVLKTLFEIVLFEDCSNQWSLSRPMLSLILVNESIYNELKMQIVASQAPERQPVLAACLDKLMQVCGCDAQTGVVHRPCTHRMCSATWTRRIVINSRRA